LSCRIIWVPFWKLLELRTLNKHKNGPTQNTGLQLSSWLQRVYHLHRSHVHKVWHLLKWVQHRVVQITVKMGWLGEMTIQSLAKLTLAHSGPVHTAHTLTPQSLARVRCVACQDRPVDCLISKSHWGKSGEILYSHMCIPHFCCTVTENAEYS
jgi:hypothetical protein